MLLLGLFLFGLFSLALLVLPGLVCSCWFLLGLLDVAWLGWTCHRGGAAVPFGLTDSACARQRSAPVLLFYARFQSLLSHQIFSRWEMGVAISNDPSLSRK